MTNREWYLNKLNAMTNEELAYHLECDDSPWCVDTCSDGVSCCECLEKWLSETYQDPMPELKVGMFVCCVSNIGEKNLGIIVNKKPIGFDGLAIAYHDGRWDDIYNVDITNIYKAVCFNGCKKETCIWQKE